MPLKLTNEVSLVDLFAIGGLVIGGLTFVFGYGVDIQANTNQIAHIQTELKRVEVSATRRDSEILVQLKENRKDMKEIRKESAEGRKDILGKLDKLIERELNGH